ncbi:hypothetical protein, partial [Schnuerera sp.]|uniref:hypothetical protein n=1 Tax=Schnuerera sp. TaxID=2794844 RepID=UPI002CA41699
MENFKSVDLETQMTIQDIMNYIEFQRREAERKRETLRRTMSYMKKEPSNYEIERVGHENDKLADAYHMVLDVIMKRGIARTSGADRAEQLQIIDSTKPIESQKVAPHKENKVVKPVIEDKKVEQQAKEIISDFEVKQSIFESFSKKNYDEAISKLEHFY